VCSKFSLICEYETSIFLLSGEKSYPSVTQPDEKEKDMETGLLKRAYQPVCTMLKLMLLPRGKSKFQK
jgi:hypothetical protein